MNEYLKFRNELGCHSDEIERLTGYTRQGLYYSFNLLAKGQKPNNRFFTSIKHAIKQKIEDAQNQKQRQIDIYDKKIERLNRLIGNVEKIQNK